MLKKILALVAMLYAAVCFAAVDVNKATAAELDSIKGIGPSISTKILDERKKGNFKDWNDLVERVKGVGEGNAAKFSTEGLTVNGSSFKGAAAAPAAAAKKDEKPAAKADAKPAAAVAPAAAAPAAKEEKKDPKAEAKAKKEADKKAKAEEKMKKAEEAKAKKDAGKNAKADAAKPAASAAKK
ncbi:MAG: helix-hairpin-helix domain-containing protein [Rhodoferax sp.]|uniref:ComEA family DNA-binding protein n=1 Tax=Rhodoferax sp. TaxID=50421 RepID=UPI0030169278